MSHKRNSLAGFRGALRNGLLWAVGWSSFVLAVVATLRLAGVITDATPWVKGLSLAARFALMGFFAGAAFPAIMQLVYGRQDLAEIGWIRFGLIGGCVTGLFVPAFLQAMNILSGDGPVPMRFVLDDSVWAVVFGGAAAVVSLKLAQRRARLTNA